MGDAGRTTEPTGRSGHDLQSLSRGLQVLIALNSEGPLSLAQVSLRFALPRTTARRILTTLVAEGCCLRLPHSGLYALAPGVTRLTCGFGDLQRLTAAAAEILPRISRDIRWPMSLAAPDDLVMRVWVSTDFASPYALARMRPGYTAPQVDTTTGLIFLAALPAAQARAQLDRIYASTWRSPLRFSRIEVEDLIERARKDDHLLLERRFPEASLGVPVRAGERVVAGLVTRYARSALRAADAKAQLLPALRSATGELTARLTP